MHVTGGYREFFHGWKSSIKRFIEIRNTVSAMAEQLISTLCFYVKKKPLQNLSSILEFSVANVPDIPIDYSQNVAHSIVFDWIMSETE